MYEHFSPRATQKNFRCVTLQQFRRTRPRTLPPENASAGAAHRLAVTANPPGKGTQRVSASARLCHGLCRNPAIPARVGALLAVSLRYTRKAVNTPETRMNTASPCRSGSLRICPFQFTLGNGMEEVVGSIPTRSTK